GAPRTVEPGANVSQIAASARRCREDTTPRVYEGRGAPEERAPRSRALRQGREACDEGGRLRRSPTGRRVVAGGGRVAGRGELPELVVPEVAGRLEHRAAHADVSAREDLRSAAVVLRDDVRVVARTDSALVEERVKEAERLLPRRRARRICERDEARGLRRCRRGPAEEPPAPRRL